eukprot:TRINITY_DN800_c4_g1_i1.p1 TRINITY_DN800_c4_g1~~TRINITY_DN800_c4_g1_i1.p1  ORF type:complete len:425 (+),score=81.85 TRINITY_DN800_c4_g1_i1:52-1275(+)
MVSGPVSVNGDLKWCQVVNGCLNVFDSQPEKVIKLSEITRTGSVVGIGNEKLKFGCEGDAICWTDELLHQSSVEFGRLCDRERELEKREMDLMWREHRVQVTEESMKYERSSWGGSEEGKSLSPSLSRSDGSVVSSISPHSSRDGSLSPLACSVKQHVVVGTTEVLKVNPSDVPSTVEILDTPSPPKVKPLRTRSAPPAQHSPPTLSAPKSVEVKVPGKVIRIYQPENGGPGLHISVNKEFLGNLTWLGYDASRRWLTTGTESTRSGLALPGGLEGQSLLRKLSEISTIAKIKHNLPSPLGTVKVGDQVRTVKFLRYSNGKQIPLGTVAIVLRLSVKSSVRVKTVSTGEIFTTSLTNVEATGVTSSATPKNSKITAYIQDSLAEERQTELHDLDDELDAIMGLAAGM